ncbi:MAG: Rid family detoxifying hydrolase [Sphingobacteriaceae bacterium]
MSKHVLYTNQAPEPIGPYSQGIQSGPFLFLSGQIAINPTTNELVEGDIVVETTQVMENIKKLLQAADCTFDQVVKTTIFLSDMSLFAQVNAVYGSYFSGAFPARETVAVLGLPKNVNVEISVIATKS